MPAAGVDIVLNGARRLPYVEDAALVLGLPHVPADRVRLCYGAVDALLTEMGGGRRSGTW